MATLYVDPSVTPAPAPGIDERISAQLAHPLIGWTREVIAASFTKSWLWARKTAAAAQTLANEASLSVEHRAEAQRIATRHDGVWRAANKLERRDNKGKVTKAVVPVRADAGDSTCPTWLDREARKRYKRMLPIVTALINLDYVVCYAASSAMPRLRAQNVLTVLSDSAFRIKHGLHGIDVLCVPVNDTDVRLSFIGVFKRGCIPPRIDMAYGVYLNFQETMDVEGFYSQHYTACMSLGPDTWIKSQINRMVDGKRQRDRVTYGCLYGKSAEALVEQASSIQLAHAPEEIRNLVSATQAKIASALEVASKATDQGDLVAAVQARSFARAYAEDAAKVLTNDYPTVAQALFYSCRFDVSGIDNAPVMDIVHAALMASIYTLPKPDNRDCVESGLWMCVEHVKIKSPQDIAALAKWMRE